MALYQMLHMALYEVVIATGIAAVLIVATIGGLVARMMMGPEGGACHRKRPKVAGTSSPLIEFFPEQGRAGLRSQPRLTRRRRPRFVATKREAAHMV